MSRYDDIDPRDIDPETNRPYSNYSSPALDTSFHEGERDGGDAGWLRWCRHAEKLIGCDLDGNEETDGFSLDFAHDAYVARKSPVDYAKAVNAKRLSMGLGGVVEVPAPEQTPAERALERLVIFHSPLHPKHEAMHEEYYEECVANEISCSSATFLDSLIREARAALGDA